MWRGQDAAPGRPRQARIAPEERKELAAALFYPRLFGIAPDTRPMFGDDIVAQTQKTIFAFGAVVA
jgi:hypothetical protein